MLYNIVDVIYFIRRFIMPVYDKNNTLIEHILDAAGNEIDIQRIHSAQHIARIKIPKLIKPADDYSVALRYDYHNYNFPVVAKNIVFLPRLRDFFLSATANYSRDLALNVKYCCYDVETYAYDTKNIYVGSNFDENSGMKGCEPWYRSYTYDYANNPYESGTCRGDDITLAIGRVPGDNFNSSWLTLSKSQQVSRIQSQAINNLNYIDLGFPIGVNPINCRLGTLTQIDPQRRWDNFGELIYGTEDGALSKTNQVYRPSGNSNSVAQYIMYYDADYYGYMFFNIHSLRRQNQIEAVSYTGSEYASSFVEYINVDVTKPIYFILDEQSYNYDIFSNITTHNYYKYVSSTFDELIHIGINDGSTKVTYSKMSLDNNMTSIGMGHLHVLKMDLYQDRFLVNGWKYPSGQTFVGMHSPDDMFVFNEFNVVNTGSPITDYYTDNSSRIESAMSLPDIGASGVDTLKTFARMWLDFEPI